MITEKELLENGFILDGFCSNRFYYSKDGYEIIEHNGIILNKYGEEIKSISELNKLYNKYIDKKIKSLQKRIKMDSEILEILKKLASYGTE